MNRRHFFRSGSGFVASLSCQSFALETEDRYRKAIGVQLYTLRNQLKADLPGTIKAVAAAGYRQVEPFGFPDANAFAMIQAAKDNGMAAHSSHFSWDSVTDPEKPGVRPFAAVLDQARAAGLSHLVIPFLMPDTRKTADDYRRLADRCNRAAGAAKTAGIQLAYHNHAFEFQPLDGGKTGYEVFIAEFVPEMMFEMDVFWVKAGGVDPVGLLSRLKGRVSQLHLKDLKAGIPLPEFGKLPDDAFQELGDGIIPMEPILKAAAAAGVAHCHVEQDQSPDPLASIGQSIRYLNGL